MLTKILSVGDTVIIRGPGYGPSPFPNADFTWDEVGMGKYVGAHAVIVEEYNDAYDLTVDDQEFGWLACWLEKAEEGGVAIG